MIESTEIVDAGYVQGGCMVPVDVEGNTGGIGEMSVGARRRPVRAPRREILESLIKT
ncbi:MAG: hypothetical protein ITG02_00480 [Patulibacter sp.]|nr:hypothetical protein [Patulibacter sp.]